MKIKNSGRKIIDDIIALIEVNARGGYYDHLCQNETKKPINSVNFSFLYKYQKILCSIGRERARLKNALDDRLKALNK